MTKRDYQKQDYLVETMREPAQREVNPCSVEALLDCLASFEQELPNLRTTFRVVKKRSLRVYEIQLKHTDGIRNWTQHMFVSLRSMVEFGGAEAVDTLQTLLQKAKEITSNDARSQTGTSPQDSKAFATEAGGKNTGPDNEPL